MLVAVTHLNIGGNTQRIYKFCAYESQDLKVTSCYFRHIFGQEGAVWAPYQMTCAGSSKISQVLRRFIWWVGD